MLEEIPIPSPVLPSSITHKNEFDIHSYDKSRINQDLWPVGESNVKTMISNFLEKVVSNAKNKSFKLINASNFINPFLYLSLSKLKYFSALKGKQDISEKNLKTFAKLALKNFNDPKNSFLYIAEANEILEKS